MGQGIGDLDSGLTIVILYMLNMILQFHPRKEIVAEQEEDSKKKSSQGTFVKVQSQ